MIKMDALEKKVLRTIKNEQLIRPGQKVIVAFSGGPDSLCLLHLLHRLSFRLGFCLHAVHVNHRLRPEAADEEVAVKKMAIKMGIPLTVCRINVEKIRKENKQMSIESAARSGRYRALFMIARRENASCIATAHHRDDRIETLLLRLLTGSGTDGLKGIPLRRTVGKNLEIVRPLWDVSRREIEHYCRIHRLFPLQDPTNLRPVYLRNRIRLNLLPFLEEEFGPHIRKLLARTADLLAEESGLLQELTAKEFNRLAEEKIPGIVTLQLPDLKLLPKAMRSRILRLALWRAGAKRVTRSQVRNVLSLAESRSPSARCPVSKDIAALREYDRLHIGRLSLPAAGEKVELKVPGCTCLPWCGRRIKAEILPAESISLPPSSREEAFLDAGAVQYPLFARTREAGDKVRLYGRPGSRKLKDIFIDKKIPRRMRDAIPLVTGGERILWVAGVDIAHDYRVTEATKRVLHLSIL